MSQELICIGAIAGAFGVKGEVRLKSYTANPIDIINYAPVRTQDGSREFEIVLTGQVKKGLTARMTGIITKEDADALKGTELFVPKSRLPQLPDDEYYYSDLVGMTIQDTGGAALGTVRSVQNHGASDLLEIALSDASATVLLPFTKQCVPTVDMAKRVIVADPPEGLF